MHYCCALRSFSKSSSLREIELYESLEGRLANQLQSTTRTTEFFVVGKMSGILVRFVILVGARPWRDLIAMQRNRWPSNSTCFFGRPLTCLALLTGLSVNLASSTFFTQISHIWVFLIPQFFSASLLASIMASLQRKYSEFPTFV